MKRNQAIGLLPKLIYADFHRYRYEAPQFGSGTGLSWSAIQDVTPLDSHQQRDK